MLDTDSSRWRRSVRTDVGRAGAGAAGGRGRRRAQRLRAAPGSSGSRPPRTRGTITVVVRTTQPRRQRRPRRRRHARAIGSVRARGPVRSRPTVVAVVKRPVAERSAPGGGGHVLGTLETTHAGFGSVTVGPGRQTRNGAWLGVISLLAGNGRLGWIPASATSLAAVGWRIYVSIDRQQITVLFANQDRPADPDIDRRRRARPRRPAASPSPTGCARASRRARTAAASSRLLRRSSRCTCPTGTAATASRSTPPPTTPRPSAIPPATAART